MRVMISTRSQFSHTCPRASVRELITLYDAQKYRERHPLKIAARARIAYRSVRRIDTALNDRIPRIVSLNERNNSLHRETVVNSYKKIHIGAIVNKILRFQTVIYRMITSQAAIVK